MGEAGQLEEVCFKTCLKESIIYLQIFFLDFFPLEFSNLCLFLYIEHSQEHGCQMIKIGIPHDLCQMFFVLWLSELMQKQAYAGIWNIILHTYLLLLYSLQYPNKCGLKTVPFLYGLISPTSNPKRKVSQY